MKNLCRSGVFKCISAAVLIAFLISSAVIPQTTVSAASALTLTLAKTNSWVEAGKTRSQYSAKIQNSGSSVVSGWTVTLAIPQGSSMSSSDGWNGIFSISDTTLTITPKDYNKQIAPGAEASDIGFIITTKHAFELTGTVTSSGQGTGTAPTESQTSGSQQGTTGTGSTTDTLGSQPADSSSAPTQDDWLHADGSSILDSSGTEVWLTGISWFGYNTGTNVFDGVWACNMNEAIASIANRGFNLLRIPISAELVLDWKSGKYPDANYNKALNPELNGKNSLEIFDYAVASCKANGIKIMLDIHCIDTDSMGHMKPLWYSDSFSTKDYYDSLTYLAAHFADDDTVVAYDIKNEPHGKPDENGAIWNNLASVNNWKNVATTAGNLILDINPNALIMIEGIEIYPKDIQTNGDFSSKNNSDYYFNWWGGNLRGVRDYPIDFGSKSRNAQIVYSPHDYGPAVYQQPWFHDGFTYESLQKECWDDNWLFISKEKIAPVLIGEWGGYMTEPNLTWMTHLRTLIAQYHLSHTFWCFNANSGDTGGLVKDDFKTWDESKYEFVRQVLWQKDGKFIGLDHVILLGKSGSGTNLSAITGSFVPTGNPSAGEKPQTPTPATAGASASGNTQVPADSGSKTPSSPEIMLAVLTLILLLAGSACIGYFTYAGKKKKGSSTKRDGKC